MWRFIFSCITLVTVLHSFGQTKEDQNLKKGFVLHDVKIGMNAIRLGRSSFGTGFSSHEIEGALAINDFNLVADFGVEKNERGGSFGYENSGKYFRFGADWNFTKDRPGGNVLSLGLRYARSSFEDQLTFVADQGFGSQTYSFDNNDLAARWFEVVFNLRGKIIANLYMGFTLRWQTFRKLNGEGMLKAYDIPGFGKTKRENSTAFDYYLAWRIPFKKKKL